MLNLSASMSSARVRRIMPAPYTASNITTFTLVSSSTGTQPFSIGHGFKKGDVPSGTNLTLDTATAQVTPISTWDDGSLKHALVAGTIALTASTIKTVTISTGTGTSGTALAESNLITAAPTASVAYGTYGAVSLAALLGTSALKVTEHAGSQYAAFQYIAAFPSDSTVRAVFYVQLWASGGWRCRVAVENGTAPTSTASKSGTATVTINGSTAYTGSVSMPQATRWDAVAGTVTLPTPSHNGAYLRGSKLVPNYGWTSVDSAVEAAIDTTYTPLALLGWSQDMGSTGAQLPIALIPHWDAIYCCTGSAQAYNSVIANGRAFGTYSCFYRVSSTNKFPKPTDYPNQYQTFDGGDSEKLRGNATNANWWEFAHVPNAGYLPWLITAERFHLETLQANAWCCWLAGSTGEAAGTARQWSSQTRGRGWRLRTIAAAAALSPDGDAIKTDWIANTAALVNDPYSSNVLTNTPATGLVATYDDKDPGTAGFQHSTFESMIVAMSIAWAWDIEPGLGSTDKTHHQALRDFAHKGAVGFFGRGAAFSEYNYRRAPGPYRTVIGSGSTLGTLYSDFGSIEAATYGDGLDGSNGLALVEPYIDDPSTIAFGESAWGFFITALSFAVDHGASGASTAWARLTSATNWTSNSNKLVYRPQNAVVPR